MAKGGKGGEAKIQEQANQQRQSAKFTGQQDVYRISVPANEVQRPCSRAASLIEVGSSVTALQTRPPTTHMQGRLGLGLWSSLRPTHPLYLWSEERSALSSRKGTRSASAPKVHILRVDRAGKTSGQPHKDLHCHTKRFGHFCPYRGQGRAPNHPSRGQSSVSPSRKATKVGVQ